MCIPEGVGRWQGDAVHDAVAGPGACVRHRIVGEAVIEGCVLLVLHPVACLLRLPVDGDGFGFVVVPGVAVDEQCFFERVGGEVVPGKGVEPGGGEARHVFIQPGGGMVLWAAVFESVRGKAQPAFQRVVMQGDKARAARLTAVLVVSPDSRSRASFLKMSSMPTSKRVIDGLFDPFCEQGALADHFTLRQVSFALVVVWGVMPGDERSLLPDLTARKLSRILLPE